jgi:hypothetical protein
MDGVRRRRIAETIGIVRLLARYAQDADTLVGVGQAWAALEGMARGEPAPAPMTLHLSVSEAGEGRIERRDLTLALSGHDIAFHRADFYRDPALGEDCSAEPVSLAEWIDCYDRMAEAEGVRLFVAAGAPDRSG